MTPPTPSVDSWRRPSAVPLLTDGTVHVWQVRLDQPPAVVERLFVSLASDERDRAERAATPAARAHAVVGRGALRAILALYLGSGAATLRFAYGPQGKPALVDAALHFNASHSHGLGLVAVARDREVGVDLERLRPLPTAEAIARRFFSEREQSALLALAPARRRGAFLRMWTGKEAYFKATGGGIGWGRALRRIEIDRDLGPAAPWSVRELAPARGYVAALVAQGQDWSVATWRWSPRSSRR